MAIPPATIAELLNKKTYEEIYASGARLGILLKYDDVYYDLAKNSNIS